MMYHESLLIFYNVEVMAEKEKDKLYAKLENCMHGIYIHIYYTVEYVYSLEMIC